MFLYLIRIKAGDCHKYAVKIDANCYRLLAGLARRV